MRLKTTTKFNTEKLTILNITIVVFLYLNIMITKINGLTIEHIDYSEIDVVVLKAVPFIRCNLSGKEHIYLEIHLKNPNFDNNHPLFAMVTNKIINLRLKYEKTEPHYSVNKICLNSYNISRTNYISDDIFYKPESFYPRQFKSISTFSGIIEGNFAFFNKAVVQFVDCNLVYLLTFIRHQNQLYFLRPNFQNSNKNNIKSETNNKSFHKLKKINTDIFEDKNLFELIVILTGTPNIKKITENKYCSMEVIADKSFLTFFNDNINQAIIYIKTMIMITNEIFLNSQWIKNNFKSVETFEVALKQINIDLVFENFCVNCTSNLVLDYVQTAKKIQFLKKNQNQFCLTHLFTKKQVVWSKIKKQFNVQHKEKKLNIPNIGITSFFNCDNDPWKMQCLLSFSHEFLHSLSVFQNENKTENLSFTTISAQTFSIMQTVLKSYCGNGILENGEECDEGDDSHDGDELCCNPKTCQFKSNAQCSPFNSLCCTSQCNYNTNNSCTPWNYCPNPALFCSHKNDFCHLKEIHVRCTKENQIPTVQRDNSSKTYEIYVNKNDWLKSNEEITEKHDIEIYKLAEKIKKTTYLLLTFSMLIFCIIIYLFCTRKNVQYQKVNQKLDIYENSRI